MSKRELFRLERLKKLLIYMLGRRPDEFALLPDKNGFIKIKEVIQALHEEEGFGFVRESHINELMMHDGREFFELDGKKIRAKKIEWKFNFEPVYDLPKLLYTCIRRRAYPVVMQKGLFSHNDSYIILFSSKDMALSAGKRKDTDPILLEIAVYDALEKGSQFFRFGELYLSTWISKDNILGPTLSSEELEPKRREKKKQKEIKKIEKAFSAGSFILNEPAQKRVKGRKKKSWKEEARRKRKKLDIF